MFASGIPREALSLFARQHIGIGIEMLADCSCTQYPRDSQDRIVEIRPFLKTYGSHAKRVVPEPEAVAHHFGHEENDFPSAFSLAECGLCATPSHPSKAHRDTHIERAASLHTGRMRPDLSRK